MSLIQAAPKDYRTSYLKGRIYEAPLTMLFPKDLWLVRLLYDANIKDEGEVEANLVHIDAAPQPYSNSGYSSVPLKAGEELIVLKSKFRRGVATTDEVQGHIRLAPIYTIKPYHTQKMDMDALRANKLYGMIYLPESEFNKESFVSLGEAQACLLTRLRPKPYELTKDGLTILDDHITEMHGLYRHLN